MELKPTRIGGDPRHRVAVVHAEGPEAHRDLRAAVGVVPFDREGEGFLTIVVRLDFDLRDERGALLPVARPLSPNKMSGDLPASPPDPSGELLGYASDFAIVKDAVDVLLVGHARGGAHSETIDGTLEVLGGAGAATFSGAFSARAGQPASAIPLRAPYLAPFAAGVTTRVHPRADDRRYVAGRMAGVESELFQSGGWQAAEGAIAPDSTLRVRGLFGAAGAASIALPGLEPVVTVDVAGVRGLAVPLRLDTLWIDADEAEGVLLWRGLVALHQPEDLHRIVLSLERVGAHRAPDDRLADTQRGSVHFAWTEEDAAAGTPPPAAHPLLEYHKEMTWGEIAPEPRVPIESYAQISAELAERPKERDKVLEAHGFDDERWLVEERAWLERFASNAMDGKGELAAFYGTLFVAAQDGLASPAEDELSLLDYAGLRAELDRSVDPSVPLERANITLAQFMRLERKWTARADGDPAVRAALNRLLEELGAGEGPLDGIPFDDEDEGA